MRLGKIWAVSTILGGLLGNVPGNEPGAAQAASLDVTRFETLKYDVSATGLNLIGYDTFQPQLDGFDWSIKKVTVSVYQSVGLRVKTSENLIPLVTPGGVIPVAIPYTFTYLISQSFDALPSGSAFPDGFETLSSPLAVTSGFANGLGSVSYTAQTAFNYSFAFDAQSDKIGFATSSNGGVFSGTLSEFIATEFADTIGSIARFTVQQVAGAKPTVPLGFYGKTAVIIQYDGVVDLEDGEEFTSVQFEQAPDIPDVTVSTVPIPAALPLLATALAGLGFLARRLSPKTAMA